MDNIGKSIPGDFFRRSNNFAATNLCRYLSFVGLPEQDIVPEEHHPATEAAQVS